MFKTPCLFLATVFTLAPFLAAQAAAPPTAPGQPQAEGGITFRLTVTGRNGGVETQEVSQITWWKNNWAEVSDSGGIFIDLWNDRIVLTDNESRIRTGGDAFTFLKALETVMREDAESLSQVVKSPRLQPGPAKSAPRCRVLPPVPAVWEGAPCKKYQIRIGQHPAQEVWVDPSTKPTEFFDAERLSELLGRLENVTQRVSAQFRTAEDAAAEDAVRSELLKLFPLGLQRRNLEYAGGKVLYETRVSNLRRIGAAEFPAIPDGYTEVSVRNFIEETSPEPVEFDDPDQPEKH